MMASALPPLAPSGALPHLHASGSVAQEQADAEHLPIVAPPSGQKRLRHIKSAAPRLASRNQLAELSKQFHRVALADVSSEYQTRGVSSNGLGNVSTSAAPSQRAPRRRTSSTDIASSLSQRPASSQNRPSSAMKGGRMDRRRSVSAPGALDDDSGQASLVELPRIRRDRVSSAMPRLGTGSGNKPNSLSFSRPVSATGRQRPSATSAYNAFATVLEEEHDELSEEAFLADMNEEEFEEWIAAQERGDRAKIATLRRLLIIKKLGINTRDKAQDWRSGEIAIPEFHCEHCKNHWLRNHELPDECPEERRKRLAAEAESQRRRYGSAKHKRRSKRSAKHSTGDEDGSDYEDYLADDGTIQRRLKRRHGDGSDGNGGDFGGSGDGNGRRGFGGGNSSLSNTITEEEEEEGAFGQGSISRSGKGGGAGAGGTNGGTGNGSNGGNGSANDDARYGKGAFVGADGKLYSGGGVGNEFSVGDIPGYDNDAHKGRNTSAGGEDSAMVNFGSSKKKSGDSHNSDSQGGGSASDKRSSGNRTSNSGGRGLDGSDGPGLGLRNGDSSGLNDPFGKGSRRGSACGDGHPDDGDVGEGHRGRRYGNQQRGRGDDDDENDGGGGAHGGIQHGRRSRRGSVAGDGKGGNSDLNSKSSSAGYGSSGEDSDGRYGGKGGHFGRKFHRRTSKSEEVLRLESASDDFSRNLQLENIRDLFTRPWSFSYFPGGADVEDSDDED